MITLQLPEYESHVDHAGLIRGLNKGALQRGKAIYERLCINCHGTQEQPGSLPTSLRFATGKFKSGHDPLTMYQTLTRGFGLMAPQTWMVPQQKYDVIHYIREAYLKADNPSQFFTIDDNYLASLPKGNTRGPAPQVIEPWVTMDYGPSLIGTFEIGADGSNIAQKGIAVRLDSGNGGIARGQAWAVFEHDTLRWAGNWTGKGFIDWNGINFNGKHQVHPRVVGDVLLHNPTGPGWADPQTGSLADEQRVVGRDGKKYGPLPRAWGKYRGLYHHGDRAVISYTVGNTAVLESPGIIELSDATKTSVFTRTLQVGPRETELVTVVATAKAASTKLEQIDGVVRFGASEGAEEPTILAGLSLTTADCSWTMVDNQLCLKIPAGKQPVQLVVWTTSDAAGQSIRAVKQAMGQMETARDLNEFTHGAPPRWPQKLTTRAMRGAAKGPLAADILTHPNQNPWLAQMRFTGLDFLPGGDEMVVCAWDGDVWLVSGLSKLDDAAAEPELTWQRIASGLFQPLGIKYAERTDLCDLPRSTGKTSRSEWGRRNRFLRVCKQRPSGHRTLSRIRDGAAD
ncbi:MAG: cytochrome c [Thermomicrobiales bacterium]